MLQRNALDIPWCNAKNRLHSSDTHFYVVVAISFIEFLPTKVGDGIIMDYHHSIGLKISKMQDKSWLTLCWFSFSWDSSGINSSIFAHKGLKYFHYGLMLLHSPVIIEDGRPYIVDALLMLISMMRQGACRLPFYLLCWPILPLWMDATMQPCDSWKGKTMNHCCSIDAHLWADLRDLLTVIGCSTIVQKMHTVFIGRQYTICMNYHLNQRSSRHLSFWATYIEVICMMNGVGPSHFSTFGWQFIA